MALDSKVYSVVAGVTVVADLFLFMFLNNTNWKFLFFAFLGTSAGVAGWYAVSKMAWDEAKKVLVYVVVASASTCIYMLLLVKSLIADRNTVTMSPAHAHMFARLGAPSAGTLLAGALVCALQAGAQGYAAYSTGMLLAEQGSAPKESDPLVP